jgi:hypothetical protein
MKSFFSDRVFPKKFSDCSLAFKRKDIVWLCKDTGERKVFFFLEFCVQQYFLYGLGFEALLCKAI